MTKISRLIASATLAVATLFGVSAASAGDSYEPNNESFNVFVGLADIGSNVPGKAGMILGPLAAVGNYAKAERDYATALRQYRRNPTAENRRELEEAGTDRDFSAISVVASVPGLGPIGIPGSLYYMGKAADKGDIVGVLCRGADIAGAIPSVSSIGLSVVGGACGLKGLIEENPRTFSSVRVVSDSPKGRRSPGRVVAFGPCEAFNQGC